MEREYTHVQVPVTGVYIDYTEEEDGCTLGRHAMVHDSAEGDAKVVADQFRKAVGNASTRLHVRVGEFDYVFVDPLTVKRVVYETRYVHKLVDEGEE